jgi:hypothetical protein
VAAAAAAAADQGVAAADRVAAAAADQVVAAADRVAAEAADRVAAEAADRVAAEGVGVIDVGFSGGHDFAAQDSILTRRCLTIYPSGDVASQAFRRIRERAGRDCIRRPNIDELQF